MAVLNLLVAPFVLVFLLIYFFMRNAEKFYHQPSSAGARRWSALAAWRLREFNELPHYLNHRWVLPPAMHPSLCDSLKALAQCGSGDMGCSFT